MFDSYNILKIVRWIRDVGATWADGRRNQLRIDERVKLFLTLCDFENARPGARTGDADFESRLSTHSNTY